MIVEGTTYNHGRPEGISEDQHPMNQFLGMPRAGPPIRTQIYGTIPEAAPCLHPPTQLRSLECRRNLYRLSNLLC